MKMLWTWVCGGCVCVYVCVSLCKCVCVCALKGSCLNLVHRKYFVRRTFGLILQLFMEIISSNFLCERNYSEVKTSKWRCVCKFPPYKLCPCVCVYVCVCLPLSRNSAVSQGAIRSYLGNFYATCQTNIKINCCKDPKTHTHMHTDKHQHAWCMCVRSNAQMLGLVSGCIFSIATLLKSISHI